MRMRTQRRAAASARIEHLRRRPRTADATIEPDPGPPPEAVFDRITGPYGGPYGHRPALTLLGACEYDEET